MKRTLPIALGLAAALLFAGASPARADHTARWWLVPGAQVTWPSDDLGLEERSLGPGLIAGVKLHPNWGLEGRLHYGKFDPRTGTGSQSKLVHGEANLTYFIDPTLRLSPYFTGGIGAADATGPLDGREFAWNAGFGFLYHFNEKVSFRIDARNITFRHPELGSQEWLESEEVFAGISIGFGSGKKVSKKEDELLRTGMIRLDNVYFDTAKATIKRESHVVLDEVAEILSRYDYFRIEIGGHTDARDTEEYNEQLSEDRANAVLDYLVSKHHLSRSNFSAKGYGESRPVGSNDSESGMARNRRVEFKVLNPEARRR